MADIAVLSSALIRWVVDQVLFSGIVVFMGTSPWGVHTEIWLGDNFHQTFMKNNFASLKMPNVWFWSLGDPTLIDI